MATQPTDTIEVFCSYSHKDEDLRKELDKHIKILERRGVIAVWHDRKIEAGEEWQGEIDKHLESADVILLLISADFIASDFCYGIEMTRAIERHDAGEACVIPVFIRPVIWKGAPFGKLQALPTDAKPVTSWPDHDEAFVIVSEGIQRAVETLVANRRSNAATPGGTSKRPASTFIPRSPVFGFVSRRDKEGKDIVERLKDELAPGKNKLVTLSGPGGIGKTTLAAEATRLLEGESGSRVVWSSAEKRTDFTLSTLLEDILTQTNHTDLRTLAPEAKEAAVRTLIADPPTVVVLDNCETIALAEQKRIEEWLAHAQCSALFTSRPRITSTLNIGVAAMSTEEAQEFLQKLIAQTQDAEIFSDEIRQRIYETAEANPFVMQWVVAQIDDAAQEPRAVLEELTHGEGDAAQRVFDRSFNLPRLGDEGRAALLALSLFIPSASRRALAEVAGFGHDEGRVNEAIKNLRALWLIKGIDENSRFTIEGLTQSLTQSRLTKDERAAEFRRRFVAYFRSYAEAHRQPTPENFAMLDKEKDNILSAIGLASYLGDWGSVVSIMDALMEDGVKGFLSTWGYWDDSLKWGEVAIIAASNLKSGMAEGRYKHNKAYIYRNRGERDKADQLYVESLQIAEECGNQSLASLVMHERAGFLYAQGKFAEGLQLYRQSLEIRKANQDEAGVAATLHEMASLRRENGDFDGARNLYNQSLSIATRLGDERRIAGTSQDLGWIEQARNNIKEARRLYNKTLEIKSRWNDKRGVADILREFGSLEHAEGNFREAQRHLKESLKLNREIGHKQGIAASYHELARLALTRKKFRTADYFYKQSMKITTELGEPNPTANNLHWLGRVAQARGDLRRARQFYTESLQIKQTTKEQMGIAYNLHYLASIEEQEGNTEKAIVFFGEALTLFEKLKIPEAQTSRKNLERLKRIFAEGAS